MDVGQIQANSFDIRAKVEFSALHRLVLVSRWMKLLMQLLKRT